MVEVLLKKRADTMQMACRRVETYTDGPSVEIYSTPLSEAISCNSVDMAELLLGADCEAEGWQREEVCWCGAGGGELKDQPPFASECTGWMDGQTPLMQAILQRNGDLVDQILAHGPPAGGFQHRRVSLIADSSDASDEENNNNERHDDEYAEMQSPMAAAVGLKAERILGSLLIAQADVNGHQYRCNYGDEFATPLVLAIMGRSFMVGECEYAPKDVMDGEALAVRMVQSLLMNRADVNGIQASQNGKTCFPLTASLKVVRRFSEKRETLCRRRCFEDDWEFSGDDRSPLKITSVLIHTHRGKSATIWKLLMQSGATDGFSPKADAKESKFLLPVPTSDPEDEPVLLLTYNSHGKEFYDALVKGRWLEECRHDLSVSGSHCVLRNSKAKAFVKPQQWHKVMEALRSKILRPYHVIVSSSFEHLVNESVQSIRCRRRPKLKKDGRACLSV